jgi:hypothetical protein
VKFTITRHSGHSAPDDALDLLLQRLGARRAEVSFAKVGDEIMATWGNDAPVSMTQDERLEIGRRAVFDIVRDACERAPELRLEWFAVSAQR